MYKDLVQTYDSWVRLQAVPRNSYSSASSWPFCCRLLWLSTPQPSRLEQFVAFLAHARAKMTFHYASILIGSQVLNCVLANRNAEECYARFQFVDKLFCSGQSLNAVFVVNYAYFFSRRKPFQSNERGTEQLASRSTAHIVNNQNKQIS